MLLRFILHRAGLASCRRRPLTSNVRPHRQILRHFVAMLLQSLPKPKSSASRLLLQKECIDGKIPVLSACGAKT